MFLRWRRRHQNITRRPHGSPIRAYNRKAGQRILRVGRAGMAVSGSDFSLEPERRSSSLIATAIDKLVALCGVVPYALVALGLRFIIARVFFLSGQMKISGPEF